MSDDVVFISDAHLGADSVEAEAPRTARLHEFLVTLPGRIERLIIAGDLFDFWFEYRTAVPRRHFSTLAVLRRLREAGLPITYMNGNHDFWLGRFLADEIGVTPHDGPLSLDLQGRRLWIHHGDGLIGGDLGYRMLKKVLRSSASVRLYQLLHPDIGIPLAHWVSGRSRHARDPDSFPLDRLWNEVALPRFAEGYDGVVLGHFHRVLERRENGRELILLGDWMTHFTYGRLRAGRFTLETWPDRA
jgi:UDP-2,3-diacylglucosamine hydrolase